MPRDYRMGMGLGLVVVVTATLWLCIRESLSTQQQMLRISSSGAQVTPAPQTPADPVSPRRDVAPSLPSMPTSDAPPPAAETRRYHVVQPGETLSAIAERYYGSSASWSKIVAANRQVLPDENTLRPDMRLLIPE